VISKWYCSATKITQVAQFHADFSFLAEALSSSSYHHEDIPASSSVKLLIFCSIKWLDSEYSSIFIIYAYNELGFYGVMEECYMFLKGPASLIRTSVRAWRVSAGGPLWSLQWLEDTYRTLLYPVHLPNDTLSLAFENTVFSLIPKQNTTVSVSSVLKYSASSSCQLSSIDSVIWRAILKQNLLKQ
jgi:hypothetical protein